MSTQGTGHCVPSIPRATQGVRCANATALSLGMYNREERPGFTLIETIFAIFIFSVGALGLAATAAVTLRSLAESAARERAARIASSRLETIRSLACGQAQGGSELKQGVQSSWTVSLSGSLVTATATVAYQSGRSYRRDSYQSVFPCAQ